MSYDLAVATLAAPSWDALRNGVALPDLRILPAEPPDQASPERGLRLCRVGRSTRTTEVDWQAGRLRIVIHALASPDDCDLALRVAEVAARLVGAPTIEADSFGAVEVGELRRLHTADWMHEQADSGARVLARLIRDGKGPTQMPGPNRSCFVGERLLAELEADRPTPSPIGCWRSCTACSGTCRTAGVFVSDGDDGHNHQTHFAVWLPGENLVFPRVDYVALQVAEGEIVLVPSAAVATLAGPHGTWLDECQVLVRAIGADDWPTLIARARPLAASPRR